MPTKHTLIVVAATLAAIYVINNYLPSARVATSWLEPKA